MIRPGTGLILAAVITFAGQVPSPAQTNQAAPTFQEVYDLIRQHATGLNDVELNRAAIQGLLNSLAPRVSLVTNDTSAGAPDAAPPVSEAKIFENDIAYLRIANVRTGLAAAVSSSYGQLNSTNKIVGLVLDLRFADGSDYDAAAHTANLFVSKSQPLLNWGEHMASSREKTNALILPVAILVNHETAGAPEALAAVLRETGAGLILGHRTAGQAMVTHDFPLANGERLRIASAPVTLGDGSSLSADGIKPDIDIPVSPEAEHAFYADAFLMASNANQLAGASTNQFDQTNESADRVPFNEAELVREHNAGENPGEETATRPPEPHVPVVKDPALARALDLLKGLAVVRESRP